VDLSKLSQKECARLLDVDDRTLRRLKDEGMPCHGEARGLFYVWGEVLPWWIAREIRMAGARLDPSLRDIPPIAVSEARKAASDADIADMKAEVMKGNLLESDAVKEVWEKHIITCRNQLVNFSALLSEQEMEGLNSGQKKALIDELLYPVLELFQKSTEGEDECLAAS
jgi:phage terminase Nu1 subunit (DNA packaging protein)